MTTTSEKTTRNLTTSVESTSGGGQLSSSSSSQTKKRSRRDKVPELIATHHANHQHNDLYNPIIRVSRADHLLFDEQTKELEAKDAQVTIKSGKIRYLEMGAVIDTIAKQTRVQAKKGASLGLTFDPVEFIDVPQELIDRAINITPTSTTTTTTNNTTNDSDQSVSHIKKDKRDKKKHKHKTSLQESQVDDNKTLEIDLPILGSSASALGIVGNKYTDLQTSSNIISNTTTSNSSSSNTSSTDVGKKLTIHTIPSQEYMSKLIDATNNITATITTTTNTSNSVNNPQTTNTENTTAPAAAIVYPVRHDPLTRSLEKPNESVTSPPPPSSIDETIVAHEHQFDEYSAMTNAPSAPMHTSWSLSPTTELLMNSSSINNNNSMSTSFDDSMMHGGGDGDKLVFDPFKDVDDFTLTAANAQPLPHEPCIVCHRVKSANACKICGIDLVTTVQIKRVLQDREWTPAQREEKMMMEITKRFNASFSKLRKPTDQLATEFHSFVEQSKQILSKCRSDDVPDALKAIERLEKLLSNIVAVYIAKDKAKDELIALGAAEKIGRLDEVKRVIEDPLLPRTQRELALAKKELQESDMTIRDQQQQIETLTRALESKTPSSGASDDTAKDQRILELELVIAQQDTRIKEYETSSSNMHKLLERISQLETIELSHKTQIDALHQQLDDHATKDTARHTKFMSLMSDNAILRESVTAEKIKSAKLIEELEKETVRYGTLVSMMDQYREPDQEVRQAQLIKLAAKSQEIVAEVQTILTKHSEYVLNTCLDMKAGETTHIVSQVDQFADKCQSLLAPVLLSQYPNWKLGANVAKSMREQMERAAHQK